MRTICPLKPSKPSTMRKLARPWLPNKITTLVRRLSSFSQALRTFPQESFQNSQFQLRTSDFQRHVLCCLQQQEKHGIVITAAAGQGEREVAVKVKDDRDILEILKDELSFIEDGGYGRSVRTPWLRKSTFQDSLTCINYADPKHTRPCNECLLLDLVNPEHQRGKVPCHFIPLNETGETIGAVGLEDN